MDNQRETLGDLLAEHMESKHKENAAKFFADRHISGDSVVHTSEPKIIWSDAPYGQSIGRARREPAENVKIVNLIDENGNPVAAIDTEADVHQPMRGRTKHFVTFDDIGYMADSQWAPTELDEKTRAYYATFPPEKIAGLRELAGAMREAEKRVTKEFDAEAALDALDDGDAIPTNEEIADFLNRQLVAAGRNPVYSATMLAAQNAEARRAEQKRKKKKRK